MKIIIVFLVSLFFGVMPQQAVAGSEVALYLDAARMSMQNEDWEQAEDRLLKVIGLEFNDVTARYQLGKVAEERGELRLAIKRYKMVVFLDKNNQPALLGWARVAEKLHSDDVLIVYQRLMKLQPDKVLCT